MSMLLPSDASGLERVQMLLHVEIGWLVMLPGSGAFTADLVL